MEKLKLENINCLKIISKNGLLCVCFQINDEKNEQDNKNKIIFNKYEFLELEHTLKILYSTKVNVTTINY